MWLGVDGYDLFSLGVGDCGWLWMSVTFFGWMCVGVAERDLFWLDVGECG